MLNSSSASRVFLSLVFYTLNFLLGIIVYSNVIHSFVPCTVVSFIYLPVFLITSLGANEFHVQRRKVKTVWNLYISDTILYVENCTLYRSVCFIESHDENCYFSEESEKGAQPMALEYGGSYPVMRIA